MNHIPNGFRSARAERAPTRRAQAKLETRQKVLQAAKRLFIERGYEAATIRDIARAAGMSTGAVFANFTDKSHLFHEVINAEIRSHPVLVSDALSQEGPVDEALLHLFSLGYKLHLGQLPLLQAAASLSWSPGMNGPLGERPQYARVIRVVAEVLDKAIAGKELRSDIDVDLLTGMLWDAYQANYRLALHEDYGLEQLLSRLRSQIAVILSGARV